MTAMQESNTLDRANATVRDVAAHFSVSERTVKRWVATTDIPHRRIAGTLRFVLPEVDEWAARNSQSEDSHERPHL
jgi:predicted DNA-binding transcriptional regulator AlpA